MKLRQWVRYQRKMIETRKIISEKLGWKRSFIEGRPLDSEGKPIPWYTYPAIEFISALQLSECQVFEYGSGNSSAFWAARVKQVTSVENDPVWANEVRGKKIPNLTVITSESRLDYVEAPLKTGTCFDIVIIDGRHRKDCAKIALDIVDECGMIIFDNADWYPGACELIRSKGWFQIDFSGLGPINSYTWTTCIFIKSNSKINHASKFNPIGGNPEGAA
jgi:hypothetical protein